MQREYQIGDTVYLEKPVRGYRYAEVVGFDGNRLIVRTTSGMEVTVYTDELKED